MTSLNVVVLGGNGFVGTEIAKQLVAKGYRPVCISRSGKKPTFLEQEPWAAHAEWCCAGDKEKVSTSFYSAEVLICLVGSPPLPTFSKSTYDKQLYQNSQPNIGAIEHAEAANLKHIVVLGAHLPQALDSDRFAYAKGKRLCLEVAESFAASADFRGASVLQPTGIFGVRYTKSGKAVNLGAVMQPLSKVQRAIPDALKKFLPAPLVSVDAVAKMAVCAALEDRYRGKFSIITNQEIAALTP